MSAPLQSLFRPADLPRATGLEKVARRRAPVTRGPVQADAWPLEAAINVVLFAGLGGACQGLEEAGCPVHVANNHNDVALAAHRALNPHTHHVRGDIFDVDPVQATQGRRVKVLWASPDCRDHSIAKGGAPRSPRVRSLPHQIGRWAAKTWPDVIFIENVREIRGWGPLIAKRDKATGRVIKLDGSIAAKGERVPVRQQQLVRDKRNLGRIFRRFVANLRSLGYAYEDRDLCCADYGVPTSRRRYFAVARRDGLPIGWPTRTHAPRAEAEKLGLLPWVAAASIIDWSVPLPSIFERKRPLAEATLRRIAIGLKRFVIDNPLPFIVPLTHHGEGRAYPVDEALRTITGAHRSEMAIVGPGLVPTTHTQGGDRVHDGAAPVPTITAGVKGGEFAVMAPVITGAGGRAAQRPPMSAADTLNTSTTKEDRILAVAHLTKFNENSVGQHPGEPIDTLIAGAPRFGLVGATMTEAAAWLPQNNYLEPGHDPADPLSTIVSKGSTQSVAAAYLAHLRGTGTALDAAGPMPALTSGGNHVATVAAFLTKYYSIGGQHQDCREPLDTLSTVDRFGIVTVTIEGQPYVITDIGMRMLKPSEAAAAHELKLPDLITIDGKTRPLTKTEAMRLVGNSVPKRMARLLAEANVIHALTAPQNERAA